MFCRLLRNGSQCPNAPCYHSQSHQELIFKEYFNNQVLQKGKRDIINVQFPDLLFFLTPIVHDVARFPSIDYKSALLQFKAIIENYVPDTSFIFWMNSPLIDPALNKKYRNVTSNRNVHLFNEKLFDLMESTWYKKGKIIPFFNLSALSLPVVSWYRDRVHMKLVFYENIISAALQTFCIT